MSAYDDIEILRAHVLVRPLDDIELTAGGIVKPDSARHHEGRAVVEKVGPGDLRDDGAFHRTLIEVGDLVYFNKFGGFDIVFNDVERRMLQEDEIHARIPAAKVHLVQHEDGGGANDHLEGEPCRICLAARDAAAQTNLLEERERFHQDRKAAEAGSSPSASSV